MSTEYTYYVYAYLREDGSPYYIGKGKGTRAYSFHRAVKPPKQKDRIVFLETNLSNVGALALERRYVEWYGRKCNGTGILRNSTPGGDGGNGGVTKGRVGTMLGKKHKPETIEKLQIEKNDNHKAKLRAATLSQPPLTCPHCGKTGPVSAGMRRWHFGNCKIVNPDRYQEFVEHNRKNCKNALGSKFTEDHKKKISEARKKWWATQKSDQNICRGDC